MQTSFFDGNNKFVIDKPIRLIELFGGYGSQHFALEYLGVDFEQWKLCEWAVKSIQAYKDAHCQEDNTDYSKDLTDEQVLNYLFNKGISQNYNEPMTYEQIKRLGSQKQRQIYNNIMATHNLVNIQQVKGSDLEIVDTDNYCYVMTYSFPCQDLSSAGLGKGMEKGSGTRSGMLWEVERILDEIKNDNKELPQVLLMENVPEVIGTNNVKHFASWLAKLESLGYHCYWQVLNAKDYGVPQNRERCFMISILGDYFYEFPQKIKLEHKLKDLLEDDVDEKFYLSDKMLSDYICDKLPENTNLKYLGTYEYNKSDKFMQGKERLNIGNEIAGTIQTTHSDGIVLISNNKRLKDLVNKIDLTKDNQFLDIYNQTTSENAGTITTRVDASNSTAVYTDYRIRKLTPKECGRLQGLKDVDIDKIQLNQSNASCYHLYGDSICIPVLVAIFSNMFNLDYTKFLDFENWWENN